jgi:hypothetical protein
MIRPIFQLPLINVDHLKMNKLMHSPSQPFSTPFEWMTSVFAFFPFSTNPWPFALIFPPPSRLHGPHPHSPSSTCFDDCQFNSNDKSEQNSKQTGSWTVAGREQIAFFSHGHPIHFPIQQATTNIIIIHPIAPSVKTKTN